DALPIYRAVAVLVVLVDAETVPAEPLGLLELVEVLVVERVTHHRIVVTIRERHPRRRRVVLHDVGHEVEVVELHRAPSRSRQNSPIASATASGSSRCGTWPESANTRRRAPRISRAHASPHGASGARRSWAPQQSKVGAVMRPRRRRRSGL